MSDGHGSTSWRRLTPDWRAAVLGALAVPGLIVVGAVIGWAEGLLPWSCRGLECIFTGLVLGYAAVMLLVWAVAAGVIALTRRRWPVSAVRMTTVRVLAAASWAVVAWFVAEGLDLM